MLIYGSGGKVVEEGIGGAWRVIDIFDNIATAIDLSPDQKWIAVGQRGTEHFKVKKAFVALISRDNLELNTFF